jgi:hypothetical protein
LPASRRRANPIVNTGTTKAEDVTSVKTQFSKSLSRLVFCAGAAGLLAAGCSKTPNQPSVSFTAPVGTSPASGTSYKYKSQPVTLAITNATRTATAAATYTIEVASDSAFANKVATVSNITEGSGGTTTATLGTLPASSGNVTYYWRSFSTVDGVTSGASPTQSFVVQQQIIVNAPVASSPASGATVFDPRGAFVTNNASRQGAVGAITYLFQLSNTANFSTITASATVAEGSGGQTSWTPSSDLPDGTLFWRVQARDDANGEASSFTSGTTFTVQSFNVKNAKFWNNYPDIANWPETAKITLISFEPDGIYVDFDRRTGSNRWPEVASFDFGPLQYTLGMCFNISNQWHCSAPIQFWDGRNLNESGPWGDIHRNWYYDARWGPMAGYQPAIGELVAVWVGQGNLRGTSGNTKAERSNFQLIRWGTGYDPAAKK